MTENVLGLLKKKIWEQMNHLADHLALGLAMSEREILDLEANLED